MIEDAKIAIKNEIKSYQSERNNSLNENFQSKITSLERTIENLKKESHSLKTQLGTIQSEIKIQKSKQVCDVFTQYESPKFEDRRRMSVPPDSSPTKWDDQAAGGDSLANDPTLTMTGSACSVPVQTSDSSNNVTSTLEKNS